MEQIYPEMRIHRSDYVYVRTDTGAQTGPGADRFWDFMKVVLERVYKQYAKGWPGGILPAWHVGAVYGEGGMDSAMLRKMYDRIQMAAHAEHGPSALPVTVGMYSGIGARDSNIIDIIPNLALHWYDNHGTTLAENVQAGWQIVDITWVPLYIARVPYCE